MENVFRKFKYITECRQKCMQPHKVSFARTQALEGLRDNDPGCFVTSSLSHLFVRRMTPTIGLNGWTAPSCEPKLSLRETVGLSSATSPWDSVLACLAEGRPLAMAFGVCRPAAAKAKARRGQTHIQSTGASQGYPSLMDRRRNASKMTVRFRTPLGRPCTLMRPEV